MANATLSLIWDERFLAYDFGPGHPFREQPRALAGRLITGTVAVSHPGLISVTDRVEPASRGELGRFHLPEYLSEVERLAAGRRSVPLDSGDTPSFPGCYEAAARICGGALAGLGQVLRGGPARALHPAGGLHHAHPGRASGFCIFNDVAVAIAHATTEGGPCRRVAYIDIDAHHGDGVMYGFYESGRLLDIDFHQDGRTLFPGTGTIEETGRKDGAGLKVNIPLAPGAGDGTFQPIFRRIVPTLLRSYRPELIVMQHGVDAHRGDRLARLDLTRSSYAYALETLIDLARELCGGRLLVTGGGGYEGSNVSRVLAAAGVLLAGLGLPASEEPLPEDWRRRFALELEEPAPEHWGDRGIAAAPPTPTQESERLVHALAGQLGLEFPIG